MAKDLDRTKVELWRTTNDLETEKTSVLALAKEMEQNFVSSSLVASQLETAWKDGHAQGVLDASKSPSAVATYSPPPVRSYVAPSPEPEPVAAMEKPSVSSSYANRTVTRKERPDPGPPMWHPPVGTQGERTIRRNATAKWGNDFNMVEYEMGLQKNALAKLIQYNKRANSNGKIILASAYQKWGENYNMMLYEAELQDGALGRMNGR